MEVYIEYAILDNLIMDFLLLKTTAYFMRVEAKFWWLVFGSVIGTAVAIVVPIFNIHVGVGFLIKIVLAGFMCFVSVKHENIFAYLKFLNVFVLLTFAVGGAVIGILSIMGIDYSVEGINKGGFLPVGVNFLCGYGCFFLVKGFAMKAMKKFDTNFVSDCLVEVSGELKKLKCFIDTGNMLVDARSNLPIAVCSQKTFKRVFNENLKPCGFMPITTASGIGMIPLYKIDSIIVKTKNGEKQTKALLGIMNESGATGADADLIISAVFV